MKPVTRERNANETKKKKKKKKSGDEMKTKVGVYAMIDDLLVAKTFG